MMAAEISYRDGLLYIAHVKKRKQFIYLKESVLFARFCDARRVTKGKVNPPAVVSPLRGFHRAPAMREENHLDK